MAVIRSPVVVVFMHVSDVFFVCEKCFCQRDGFLYSVSFLNVNRKEGIKAFAPVAKGEILFCLMFNEFGTIVFSQFHCQFLFIIRVVVREEVSEVYEFVR